MNIKKSILIAVIFWLLNSVAHAVVIELSPVEQDVELGNSVSIDINISGLGDGSADSLGAFDLDLLYDSSLLDFNSVVFGDQLDPFGLGSVTSVDSSVSGIVNIFELSLDSASDLDAFQTGSFTLATVTFDSLLTGTAELSLGDTLLSDAYGSVLLPRQTGNASVSISVPEPQTLLLLLPMLLLISRRLV